MGTNEKEKHMMILDALTDELGRSEDQSAEKIKEELREEGVDEDGKFLNYSAQETARAN